MLTRRQKIAQMLIVGFSGTTINEDHHIYQSINKENLGGVILFDHDLLQNLPGKNIVDKKQIQALTKQLRRAACNTAAQEQGLDLFIAVDFEGGAVDRFRHVPGALPTIKPELLQNQASNERLTYFQQMAKQCHDLGFNLNFAPVVDLNQSATGIIGALGRCFAKDAQTVSSLALEFIDSFAQYGIHCCYKHFPGHGSASGDTHKEFVDVTDCFSLAELIPYEEVIAKKRPILIMTAHVVNKKLDESGLPATLSKEILTELLRKRMAYEYVVISDDIQMHALSQYFSLDEILSQTINAGCDMLIIANQLAVYSPTEIIEKIDDLIDRGEIPAHRVEEAFQRISTLKKAMRNSCHDIPVLIGDAL